MIEQFPWSLDKQIEAQKQTEPYFMMVDPYMKEITIFTDSDIPQQPEDAPADLETRVAKLEESVATLSKSDQMAAAVEQVTAEEPQGVTAESDSTFWQKVWTVLTKPITL